MRTMPHRLGRLAAVAATLVPLAAAAQLRPWVLGAEQAVTWDDNLYRVADGTPRSTDLLSTSTLSAGLDAPFGADRLTAAVAGHANRYRDHGDLDNLGSDGFLALDWQSANRLSGTVRAAAARSLAPFGVDLAPVPSTRNELRTSDIDVRTRLGLPSLSHFELALRHETLDYTAPEYAGLELWQRSAGLSYHFRTGGVLPWAVGVRFARGAYPHALWLQGGLLAQDDFHRSDVDLSARWVPTGRSTLDVRLSGTRESHRALTARNVRALTAALTFRYEATAKLHLTLDALRDTGAGSTFLELGDAPDRDTGRRDGSRLADTVRLAAAWSATDRVSVRAGASWTRRELVDVQALLNGAPAAAGVDHTNVLSLGVDYTPAPRWTLGCGVDREARTTDSAASYAYRDVSSHCSIRFLTD